MPSVTKKYRVLIVDDHTIVRQGVRATLFGESDFDICAEAASGKEAIELAGRLEPDVVVLDLTLPDTQGTQAIVGVRAAAPQAKIVVLSMHEQAEIARTALRAGAHAYVLKSDATEELASSMRAAMQGRHYMSARFADKMVTNFVEIEAPAGRSRLSMREMQLLTLLARGRKNREIAAEMSLSARTVETQRHRLMRKLKFASFSDLVRFALRNQLIEP